MSKLLLIAFILLLFTGCVSRTEYGRRRLLQIGNHKADAGNSVYDVIDTSKLYQILSAVYLPDNKPLTSVNRVYLKFYANGRVGTFYAYRSGDISSLNPKRADIGYYSYKNNNLEINTFFEHPQGGGWMKERIAKLNQDTIQGTAQKILTTYKALRLTPEFLIYKPDW